MGRAWDFLLAFFQLLSNHFAFLEVTGEKCGRKEDGAGAQAARRGEAKAPHVP